MKKWFAMLCMFMVAGMVYCQAQEEDGTQPSRQAETDESSVLVRVAATGVLGDAPEGWHHYSFIWNRDGLDLPGVRGNYLVFAIDGKIVTARERGTGYPEEWEFHKKLESGSRLVIRDAECESPHPIAISDLKVWNVAKFPEID